MQKNNQNNVSALKNWFSGYVKTSRYSDYESLMNKNIVDIKDVKNINDLKLLQAGLVYDLNFKPSFQFIKNRHYLESLRDSLPEKKEITEIFSILKSYIEDRSA